MAELPSVSPAFTRYLYSRARQGTQAGQSEVKASTAHASATHTSTYRALDKGRKATTEYTAESGLIPAVINGVELYPTRDNQLQISRMGLVEFVSLVLADEDEVDGTMTGITGDSIPLSCCIHKAQVRIGGVVVYAAIFASR